MGSGLYRFYGFLVLYLSRPKAVIFDMDGLLIDSERIALGLMARVAEEIGFVWDEGVGRSMIGLNSRDSDRLLASVWGPTFPLASFRERFGVLYEAAIQAGEIPIKPFVPELLDYLEVARIPCAVATSTRRTRAEAKLARLRLLPRFGALACGDEVSRGKPAPDIFELAAARLGVEPRDCLALEDSNAGIRAALTANMTVVMVPDLLEPEADIRRNGVACVDSLKDVLVALMN